MAEADIKRVLTKVYDYTIMGERGYHPLYNMINVASVIGDVRPGAIITNIPEDKQDELKIALSEVGIKARRYKERIPTVMILVRNDHEDLVEKMNSLNEKFAQSDNIGDQTVGEIIGYYEPSRITNIVQMKPRRIGFMISVQLNDGTIINNIQHFPQRISDGVNIRERFENYKRGLENMVLPDGFEITSVEPYNNKNQGGGKRRKTKGRRSLKKRKSLKKSRK
jgi:hypothetical protein